MFLDSNYATWQVTENSLTASVHTNRLSKIRLFLNWFKQQQALLCYKLLYSNHILKYN